MPTDVEESTDKAVLAEFLFSPSSTATRFSPFLALSFVGEELCRDDVAKGQGRAQAGLVGAHGRAQDADPPGAAREWDEVVEREHLGGLHGQVQAQLHNSYTDMLLDFRTDLINERNRDIAGKT